MLPFFEPFIEESVALWNEGSENLLWETLGGAGEETWWKWGMWGVLGHPCDSPCGEGVTARAAPGHTEKLP